MLVAAATIFQGLVEDHTTGEVYHTQFTRTLSQVGNLQAETSVVRVGEDLEEVLVQASLNIDQAGDIDRESEILVIFGSINCRICGTIDTNIRLKFRKDQSTLTSMTKNSGDKWSIKK